MSMKKKLVLVLSILLALLLLAGCQRETYTDISASPKTEPYKHPETLISPEELNPLLKKPNVTIIDTRPLREYLQGHIPSAICFPTANFLRHPQIPGKLIDPVPLGIHLRRAGVNNTDHIIVYSDNYSHAGLWFYLNNFTRQVQILNGGLTKWQAEGYPVNTGQERKLYVGDIHLTGDKLVKPMEDIFTAPPYVRDIAVKKEGIIIDARPAEEYLGEVGPPGMRGHILGAINVTWDQLVNEDFTFKTAPELRKFFQAKGIAPDQQIIVYSNTPLESSFVYFVLDKLLGYPDVKFFDAWYYYRVAEFPHAR